MRTSASALLALLCVAATPQSPPTDSSLAEEATLEVSAYQDSDAVSVLTPALSGRIHDVLARWALHGSYLVDVVSAASVDVVSAASPAWREIRHAGSLGARFEPRWLGGEAQLSISREPDYTSLSAGGAALAELANRQLELGLGYAYTRDEAGRTGTPFDVYSLVLHQHTLSPMAEVVVNPSTTVSVGAEVRLEHGRQEKPYRYLPLFDAQAAEQVPAGASFELVDRLRLPGRSAERVPDTRQRYALLGRLAYRGHAWTLIAKERLYADSWGLVASTSDLRPVFDLSRRLFVWPALHAHWQTGASFWQRAYTASVNDGSIELAGLRTGDRELSPLWTTSLGAGARFDMGPAAATRAFSVELMVDGAYTRYLDALYIEERWAGLGSLLLSGRFE